MDTPMDTAKKYMQRCKKASTDTHNLIFMFNAKKTGKDMVTTLQKMEVQLP